MRFDDAMVAWKAIEETSFDSLRRDLIKCAFRYARYRCDWYLADNDERMKMDENRTIAHNAFIDSCNILSRNMMKADEDNEWRALLGDDRKDIGDFACFLVAILGVKAR